MKKFLTIAAVFLFFLLLLAAILFKVLAPESSDYVPVATTFPVATTPSGVTSEDPAQFVTSFYEWYLFNFSRDPLFPHPENRDEVLSPWLSPELLAEWDATIAEIEVNPVLLTAEDPAAWGSGVSARLISESIRSRTVYATIGSGTSAHSYTVELIQTDDYAWKIQSVASAL